MKGAKRGAGYHNRLPHFPQACWGRPKNIDRIDPRKNTLYPHALHLDSERTAPAIKETNPSEIGGNKPNIVKIPNM